MPATLRTLASSLPSVVSVPSITPCNAFTAWFSGALAATFAVSCSRNGTETFSRSPDPKKALMAFCLEMASSCFCTLSGLKLLSIFFAISSVSCTLSSIEPRKDCTASRYSPPASDLLSSSVINPIRRMLSSVCAMFPSESTSISASIGEIFRHASRCALMAAVAISSGTFSRSLIFCLTSSSNDAIQ